MVSNSSSFGQDLSEIGEALGLTGEDPVLPGDPATLGETAQHLSTLGQSAEKAARGFAAIDTQRWSGQAADGFRGFLETSPPRWRTAADAFEKAGTAVGRYVQVLADAQRQAAQAQRQLDDAEQRSQQARQAHNAQVDAANAGGTQPGMPPAAFVDPAAEQRAAAQHQLDRARDAVQTAGQEAARAVTAAANTAPGKPGFFAQAGQELTDAFQEAGRTVSSMASGLGEAVGGVVQLARTLNPIDPWNLTHPTQAVDNASTLAAGMAGVVENPWQGAKTVANVDGWKSDPARAVGSCIPDAVASLAGGAGVASRAATGVRRVSSAASDATRGSRATRIVRAAEHSEHGDARAASAGSSGAHTGQGAQWGRWPEPAAQRPDIAAAHADARPTTRAEQSAMPAQHNEHGQPWRPSDPQTPSARGEHDPHVPAHGRDPGTAHGQRPEVPSAQRSAIETRLNHDTAGERHSLASERSGGADGEHAPSGRHAPAEHLHHQPEHGPEHGHGDRPHDGPEHEPEHQPHEHDHPDDHGDGDQHGHDLETPGGHDPGPPPVLEPHSLRDMYHGEQHGGVFKSPVRYLDHEELQTYRLHVDDEGLLREANGKLFDTRDAESPTNGRGHAIFVADPHGNLFASHYAPVGEFHHSSFLGGEPVGTAGELAAEDGMIRKITNNSGHYRPDRDSCLDFLRHMIRDRGLTYDGDNLDVWFSGHSSFRPNSEWSDAFS